MRWLDDQLSARLRQVENRLEPASARMAVAAVEQPAPVPQAKPTVPTLVGVKPVGSKMPDAERIYEFDLSTAPTRGPVNAPILIVDFSDFQCSFCRKAQPTLARIQDVYGEQPRWVWKHLPLSMHKDAPMAHMGLRGRG